VRHQQRQSHGVGRREQYGRGRDAGGLLMGRWLLAWGETEIQASIRDRVISGLRAAYLVLSTEYTIPVCGLLVSFALCAVGCNRGPALPKRGELSGKITLDGKPVANGQIRLISLEPNGINAAATVTGGEYHVPADEGPAKGKYRVEFSVPSAAKRRV